MRMSNLWIYEMTLFINTGIMLWALGDKGVSILKLTPIRYLGRISYTVYLIHLTAYFVASRFLHGRFEVLSATLAATLLYASASWFFFERPLLAPIPQPVPVLELEAA
jgi:peptidoglycan/LPS O-acetylase OafA/YrhL